MDPDYWDMIPTEILEKILLSIPTYQLPLNESWVCKRWTRIILQPQFWVHKLKIHGINVDEIWSVLQDFENYKIVSCLYYGSLYQEHHTQQTPLSNFVLRIPTDEELKRKKPWVISNNFDNLLMTSGLLVCRSHCSQWHVCLKVMNQNIKALPLLLKLLEARKVALAVNDDYAFWNFSPHFNYFQIWKGSSDKDKYMKYFRGCLPTLKGLRDCLPVLEGLPSSLNLYLSIGVDDQNVAIDPGFSKINKYPGIGLHLKAGTIISNLPKISFSPVIYIFVSGLEESHILWMIEITKNFVNNIQVLAFFNYQLDLNSSENLLNSIAEAGLDLELNILCSSPTLSSYSEDILNDLALTLWPNCAGFRLFDSDDDLMYNLPSY